MLPVEIYAPPARRPVPTTRAAPREQVLIDAHTGAVVYLLTRVKRLGWVQ